MVRPRVVALTVAAVGCAVLLLTLSARTTARNVYSESAEPATVEPVTVAVPQPPPAARPGSPHEYFEHVSRLPGVVAAYSLRDTAEITKFRRGRSREVGVTYDPAGDRDSRRQDAARFWMSAGGGNSLRTQLWLPTNHTPRSALLVTWDDWLGAEFAHEQTGVGTYKAWNLCGPENAIYTEVQHRLRMARGHPELSAIAIRQYRPGDQGPNATRGPVGPTYGNYGGNVIGPMAGEFGARAETWTRYWLFVEPDGEWYRLYFWVADETRGPVQIYDGLQIRPRAREGRTTSVTMDGTWDIFRLEYNTSTSGAPKQDLVGYARNVVMIQNISGEGVRALLQQPVR
jgi:hypothetical protein